MRVLHVEDNPVDADLTARALKRAMPAIELVHVGTLGEAVPASPSRPTSMLR